MQTAPTTLVTGSSGHLGHALMLLLPSHNLGALGTDLLPSSQTHAVGSITSRSFVHSIFASQPNIATVIHTATLHKPHIGTHSTQDFIDTNVTGTLNLLEEAAAAGVKTFVFVSTTSAFGAALNTKAGEPAAWIDENVKDVSKNIYGTTKVCAEQMCEMVQRQSGMSVIVLRTSRFFPEDDDNDAMRGRFSDENLKVLELCYRRVDIEDVVSACVAAKRKGENGKVRWGKYIVSAPTPFRNTIATVNRLGKWGLEGVVEDVLPGTKALFAQRDWQFLDRLDRVYDSGRAIKELDWQPKYTFAAAMEALRRNEDWRSQVTHRVGKKGYHTESTGVYTIR